MDDTKKALTRRLLIGEVCENCLHNSIFLKQRVFGKNIMMKGCRMNIPAWKNDIRSCNMFFPTELGFYKMYPPKGGMGAITPRKN